MCLDETFKKLYRYLPVGLQDMAYNLGYLMHLEPNHEYVQIVLDEWKGRNPEDPELAEALRYIKATKEYRFIPYEYIKKYQKSTVKAKKVNGFPAISLDGKNLFFPKSFGNSWATGYYRFLSVELDPESPHRYFSETFPAPQKDEILLDVGAAEAVIALQYVEKVKHVFIFECDENWIEALHKTFEPYKDKVTIINKYVSDKDNGACIKLDSFIRNYYGESGFNEHFVVKADIEGAEAAMLWGSEQLIANQKTRFAVCTYHKPDDAQKLKKLFQKVGYRTEFAPKYIFMGGGEFGIPSLRKGVIRAWHEA